MKTRYDRDNLDSILYILPLQDLNTIQGTPKLPDEQPLES